jgi:membrane fusion protein (multidrug efflux system)
MHNRITRSVWALAGLLSLASGLAGCQQQDSQAAEVEHAEQASRLLASQPLKQDTEVTRRYVCQVHAMRHITLKALERGYLQSVSVREGQRVEKGTLMFSILPLAYEAELAKAKAEAQAAKVEYDNTAMLAENKVVAPTELAIARARYEQALAEVRLAQVHVDFTRIHAPFDGIMDTLHVREGSMVEEGSQLTTLSDNSQMWVYFNVPEAEYLDYAAETKRAAETTVELLMANGKVFEHPGKVATIEADFNNETGTIPFRADFPNPEGLLRHGQTGNILMKTVLPGALLIPQKATFQVLDHTFVFVVGEDSRVRQQRIEIAEELEDLFVVTKGLADTDRILLEGVRQVADGQAVEYEFQPPAEAYSRLKTSAE